MSKVILKSVRDLIKQVPDMRPGETLEQFKHRYDGWKIVCMGVALGNIDKLLRSSTDSITFKKVEPKDLKDREDYLVLNEGMFLVGEWDKGISGFKLPQDTWLGSDVTAIYELPTGKE